MTERADNPPFASLFAAMPRRWAIGVLLALLAAMAWSAFAVPQLASAAKSQAQAKEAAASAPTISDFDLYANIHARMETGESYYAAALDEHRTHNYPTRPFFTVRLPSLALAQTALGASGVKMLGIGLLAACALGFWTLFGERAPPLERIGALLLVVVGGAGLAAEQAPYIHELYAGLLLALSTAIYRNAIWWPSLVVAALALAVRELALPFLLLWGAVALYRRSWAEAAAVALVIAGFAVLMWLHYQGVAAQYLPGDRASPGWNGLVGPALPLLALSRLTALLAFPLWLAAPLAILPLLGWLSLGTRLGVAAALWFAGFFLAMSIFARMENFYWVLLVLPAYLAGFAFVPRALVDLLISARGVE